MSNIDILLDTIQQKIILQATDDTAFYNFGFKIQFQPIKFKPENVTQSQVKKKALKTLVYTVL